MNTGGVNAVGVNGAASGAITGTLELPLRQESLEPFVSLPLQQISEAPSGDLVLLLHQVSYKVGELTLPLQQISEARTGVLELPLQQVSYASDTLELPLEQQSVGDFLSDTTIWRLVVLLDGIDISASLTGDWLVDAEEGGARIAEFSMMPALGAIDPVSWVRKPVAIDFESVEQSGNPVSRVRIFTGIVDVPEYDVSSRITRFLCTDALQEKLERTPLDVIDTVMGGEWSQHVFNEDVDGWQRAQDRLSTQQKSYDLDATGIGHLGSWDVAGADFSFDDSNHINDSRSLSLANSRDMHNTVNIGFDFRFTRLRQRDKGISWTLPIAGWCEYLKKPFTLPTRAMVQQAAEGNDWTLQGEIVFEPVPEPQVFNCWVGGSAGLYPFVWGFQLNPGGADIPQTAQLELLCRGASFKLSRRWAQTVTEQYAIKVYAKQSVTELGEIAREDQGSVVAEHDATEWQEQRNFQGASDNAQVVWAGEYIEDMDTGVDDGRAASETAMRCLIGIAKTGIRQSHRQNYVQWSCLINPMIERHNTAGLTTSGLSAVGKVSQITHHGSIDEGFAYSTVKIALSRSGAVGANGNDPEEPPAQPDTVPVEKDTGYPVVFTANGNSFNHIGGENSSPDFNEDWEGFCSNYDGGDPNDPALMFYPYQFRVKTPEIDDDDRQAVVAQAESIVNVEIPIDTLSIA